jgi:hypothetical protein
MALAVARLLLAFVGLATVAIGIWGLVDPVGVLAAVDLATNGAGGTSEARATYGGLLIGLGLPLLAGALREEWTPSALRLSAFVFLGLGAGRVIGLLAAGAPAFTQVVFAVFELVVGIASARLARDVS